MVNDTNYLHSDLKNYKNQNNVRELAETLLQLGLKYF
jgi:hypothetical protein